MALDIIGAGFGRTGTSSMKIALEHLGFGPCHHMFEVRDNPHLLHHWEKIVGGQSQDWDEAFAGYRSQTDWPGALVWRELAAHYSSAKVVLTVRDPDDWYDSFSATIVPLVEGHGTYPDAHANRVTTMGHKLLGKVFGAGRWKDRADAISVFNAHNAEVQRTIPPDRLLTLDVSQGWEPLCAFLGVSVPAISFPKLNSSKQFVESWKEETADT
jgi:hypothetical protein